VAAATIVNDVRNWDPFVSQVGRRQTVEAQIDSSVGVEGTRCHAEVGRRLLPNRTEFINFSETDLINHDSSFCTRILLAIDLLFHVFSF